MLCRPRTQSIADVVSLLTEIRITSGKNDCWTGTKPANVPAVMAAAAAASGGNLKLTEAFNFEVLSTGVASAAVKSNHAGEIAGMKRLYESIGGHHFKPGPTGSGLGIDPQYPEFGVVPQNSHPRSDNFNEVLLSRFVHLLQQFVTLAEKGGEVDKSSFRETCSQAAALLLSDLVRHLLISILLMVFLLLLPVIENSFFLLVLYITELYISRVQIQNQLERAFHSFSVFFVGALLTYAHLMPWKLVSLFGLGWSQLLLSWVLLYLLNLLMHGCGPLIPSEVSLLLKQDTLDLLRN